MAKLDFRLRGNDSVAQEVPGQPGNSNMQINHGNRLKIRLPEAIVACKGARIKNLLQIPGALL